MIISFAAETLILSKLQKWEMSHSCKILLCFPISAVILASKLQMSGSNYLPSVRGRILIFYVILGIRLFYLKNLSEERLTGVDNFISLRKRNVYIDVHHGYCVLFCLVKEFCLTGRFFLSTDDPMKTSKLCLHLEILSLKKKKKR